MFLKKRLPSQLIIALFSVNVHVFGYMGVSLRWLHTGTAVNVKILTNAPVKGSFTIEPQDKKMTLKYDMPKEVSRL